MSTINNIGIPGVGTGVLHPKQRNRWRVTFANMGGGVGSNPLSMQATTISRPTLDFNEVPLHRYNSIAYIAGKHTFGDLTLTVEDDVTSSASAVIQEQLQKQQWLIGAEGQWLAAAGEGSLYKFVTYLDQLDGNDQVIERWVYEGCFIKSSNYNDLDYSSGDAVTISLTIRYDHARQDIVGFKYDQGKGVATGGAGTTQGVV
jgi:hypothetical protein